RGAEPFAEALDLGDQPALARIYQPVGPAAPRNLLRPGDDQPALVDVVDPQEGAHQRKALPAHRRVTLVGLVVETQAPARLRPALGFHPASLNHCSHQLSCGLINGRWSRSAGWKSAPNCLRASAMQQGEAIGVKSTSNNLCLSSPSQSPRPARMAT